MHVLYPPLWAGLRRSVPPPTPVLLSFHSERALSFVDEILTWPESDRRRLHVAGVSRAIVARLAERFGHAEHLPDGVFEADWAPRDRPEPGPPRVGMAGLLAEQKGFTELLLPAAARLGLEVVTHWRPANPPGASWPEERLLPAGCLGPLYARMDLYAMLSRSEGTPLPLLEAMASGVAPIATLTGAAPDLIEDGENGFLLRDRSPAALEALLRTVPDRGQLHQMGVAARQRVLRDRSGEAAVGAVRRLWSSLLGRTPFALDRSDPLNILIVTAHPDDETLWAGGTRLLFPWHRWTVACATATAGSPRAAELHDVAEASHARVVPLGLPDDRSLDLRAGVARALAPLDPGGHDWILCHGPEGEYGHPHHRAVHQAVLDWLGASQTPVLAFSPRRGPTRLHLPPVVQARKVALLERYREEERRTRLVAHPARHVPWEDWCHVAR